MAAKRSKLKDRAKRPESTAPPGGTPAQLASIKQVLVQTRRENLDLSTRLEQLEARLEALGRVMPGAYFLARWFADARTMHVDFVSPGAEELLGLEPRAIIEDPALVWTRVHPDDRQFLRVALTQGLRQQTTEFECRFVEPATPTQATRWFRLLLAPTRSKDGEGCTSFCGMVEEITERKANEESIRASERQFRQLAENIAEVFWVSEVDPRMIRYVSPSYRDIWGRSPESLYANANSFLDGIHPDDRKRVEESLSRARLGGYDEVYRVVHFDGSVRIVRARAFPVRDEHGEVYRIAGIVEDITVSKQAENELQAERRFLEHLLQVQEGERKLVAYDIHDGFVQSVIATVMHLEGLSADPDLTVRVREKLSVPLKLLRGSIDEARRMISGLRPPIIDEQGLVAAIRFLVDESPPEATRVTFTHSVNFPRLDGVLEGTLFRIVQEALSNVRRHSRAGTADVKLICDAQHVTLIISDSGIGFDPSQSSSRQFGLRGIRERAMLIGGTVAIRSAPGEGTQISVELPLPPQSGDPRGE